MNNNKTPILKAMLLGCWLLCHCMYAAAQQAVISETVSSISVLFAEADSLKYAARYQEALDKMEIAFRLSKKHNLAHPEALSLLKMADIHYRCSEFHLLPALDSAALQIGLRTKDNFIIALAYYQLGVYFMSKDQHTRAMQLFNQSLTTKFGKEISSYTGLVYNDMGFLYGKLGSPDKQIDCLLKSLSIQEQLHEETGIAQACNNLAAAYNDAGNYHTALIYGKKAVELRMQLNDVSGVAISANNLSQIYLRLDSIDNAVHYQKTGLQYAEKSGLESRMAQCYISLSLLLNRQKKNAEALEYEKKAIALLQKTGNNEMAARRQIAAGILSKATGDTSAALQFFKQAFDLSTQLNNKANIRDIYLHRTILYKDYKDYYNAYENYKKYILYRDSIINQETLVRISDVEARYETEKKDHEIKQLATANRIQELETEKQKALAARNALLAQQKQTEIDLLSQSGELQEIRITRQQEELEKQELTLQNHKQALELASKEKELQTAALRKSSLLTNFIIAGTILLAVLTWFLFNRYKLTRKIKEQQAFLAVRNDIARNLHDDIGSTLSNIHILHELARKNAGNPSLFTEYMHRAGEDIQRVSENLNDIVWNINPRYDDLQQLFIRMKRYAADMLDGRNIEYEFQFPDGVQHISMSMERRRDFYLIFKEAVNNLAKYSQATTATLSITINNNKLILQVADNGTGFDNSVTPYGNGLTNMKQRAAFWNDSVSICSAPGKGTIVTLEVLLTGT